MLLSVIIGTNIALVLLATLYDAFVATSDINIGECIILIFVIFYWFINILVEKFLLCFSIINYKRIATKMLTNDDANRLKCMQGLRVVATTAVIVAHGLMNSILKPIKNPEYVEEVRIEKLT